MFNHFMLNPHLAILDLVFVIGLLMLGYAPIHYRIRKKIISFSISLKDISLYNHIEKRLLYLGMLFTVLGLLGNVFIIKNWGYRMIDYDQYGNKIIVNSKQGAH